MCLCGLERDQCSKVLLRVVTDAKASLSPTSSLIPVLTYIPKSVRPVLDVLYISLMYIYIAISAIGLKRVPISIAILYIRLRQWIYSKSLLSPILRLDN